jgi:hypothetical protein
MANPEPSKFFKVVEDRSGLLCTTRMRPANPPGGTLESGRNAALQKSAVVVVNQPLAKTVQCSANRLDGLFDRTAGSWRAIVSILAAAWELA